MIDLLSSNDYRNQFNGVKFPKRLSEFASILIEFSIERSIMWDIDRDEDREDFTRLLTRNRDSNLIEIDFNDESYANSIDCWIFYSDGMKEFSFNTVDRFQQFLIDSI